MKLISFYNSLADVMQARAYNLLLVSATLSWGHISNGRGWGSPAVESACAA